MLAVCIFISLSPVGQGLESQLASQAEAAAVTRALKADVDAVPQMKAELEKLRLDNEQLRWAEATSHCVDHVLLSAK